jgi:hypothetical protein
LHLLKRQAERRAELFLADAEHRAAQPDARADMDIDRVRWLALAAAPSRRLCHPARMRSRALQQR